MEPLNPFRSRAIGSCRCLEPTATMPAPARKSRLLIDILALDGMHFGRVAVRRQLTRRWRASPRGGRGSCLRRRWVTRPSSAGVTVVARTAHHTGPGDLGIDRLGHTGTSRAARVSRACARHQRRPDLVRAAPLHDTAGLHHAPSRTLATANETRVQRSRCCSRCLRQHGARCHSRVSCNETEGGSRWRRRSRSRPR
jgi:hypothetical protein